MKAGLIARLFAMVLLALLTNRVVGAEQVSRQSIARLKKTPAESIDRTLPAVPFEEWIARVAGDDARVRWQPGDCALAPVPMPRTELPRCVRIDLIRDSARAHEWWSIQIQIQVATGDEVLADPRVVQILVFNKDAFNKVGSIKSPDTLSEMLKEVKAGESK